MLLGEVGEVAVRRTPLWWVPVRLLLAVAVLLFLRCKYRVRLAGRLPRRRGATLLIANHQHDLESVLLPAVTTLRGPWREPVFSVTSQRLFEPGFLTPRLPPALRRFLWRFDLDGLLRLVGGLPIENEPLSRALSSLAGELRQSCGDLPLADVLTPRALERLATRAGRSVDGRRLSDLQGPALAREAMAAESLLALREPYRTQVRDAVRPRIEAQLAAIEASLRAGGTIYLTPEGRITRDGRLGRLRAVLDRLLPLAGGVYLAAVSYDPFVGRRLSLHGRLLPLRDARRLRAELLAARPVTVSQVLADWLTGREEEDGFTAAQAIAGVSGRLAGLPAAAAVEPHLRRRPAARVRAALATLRRQGLLVYRGDLYRRTALRTDRRLHEAHDIVQHQSRLLAETLEALRAYE